MPGSDRRADNAPVLLRYLRSLTGFERDARLFLFVTLAYGSAVSLWWIDFNLYLHSLGIDTALIGLIAMAGSAASLVVAFPASILSDRLGRRRVLLGGGALMTAAFAGLLVSSALPTLLLMSAAFAAGSGAMQVVAQPFLAEHSRPEERSELFAVQFAISSGTNVVAALAGGFIAQQVASSWGFDPQGPEAYRVLIALMAGMGVVTVLMLMRLRDDRPAALRRGVTDRPAVAAGPRAVRDRDDATGVGVEVATGRPTGTFGRPDRSRQSSLVAVLRGGFRVADRRDFARLLLPGFLISLGAGQVIPFLNVFIEGRFHLELASLNALFAITSLGTLVATLMQPALARRWGKMGSVVIVQGASIPFIVVLGFSPLFWTVAIAMAVRNSLMNAGNPIFGAFAMERVRPDERATFSAASSLFWALGWVIAAPWYSLLQATLGFDAGYTVNFLTIIGLYSAGTVLYWVWFGRDERDGRRTSAAAERQAATRVGS
jgi:MFS family permease